MRKIMKIIFLTFCLATFFTSCNENRKELSLKKEEHFSVTDSINYIKSSTLKGFSEFIINQISVKDIIKIHNRNQAELKPYLKVPFKRDFTEGYFKIDYFDEDLISLLNRQKRIAQYHISNYKINELVISSVYLLCIDDTLSGIYIPYCDDIIIETFIKKYGSGSGYKINNSELATDPISKKESIILDVSENRVWENKSVKAEYCSVVTTKYSTHSNSYLLISDKSGRFTRLDNLLKRAKQLKKNEEDKQKDEIINII